MRFLHILVTAAIFFCALSNAAIAPPNTKNEGKSWTIVKIIISSPLYLLSEEGYWREYGNERLQRQLTAAASINRRVAKNVVIFVGDGMGPQVVG